MHSICGKIIQQGSDTGFRSVGSVTSAQLAEGNELKVPLVEAGSINYSLFINTPTALGFPLENDKFNCYIHNEEEAEFNHQKIYIVQSTQFLSLPSNYFIVA